jgi:phosphohistidine phosphatase, SixA
MELILWRHAEAEDGSPDLERELTGKGHKQAEKMAAFLRPRLPGGSSRVDLQACKLGTGRRFTTS